MERNGVARLQSPAGDSQRMLELFLSPRKVSPIVVESGEIAEAVQQGGMLLAEDFCGELVNPVQDRLGFTVIARSLVIISQARQRLQRLRVLFPKDLPIDLPGLLKELSGFIKVAFPEVDAAHCGKPQPNGRVPGPQFLLRDFERPGCQWKSFPVV